MTAAILEMRCAVADTEWVFPAPTRSGHIYGRAGLADGNGSLVFRSGL